MVLAVDQAVINWVVFFHVLAVIVGFGSTFVWPALASYGRTQEPAVAYAFSSASLKLVKVLTSYPIYAAGALGLLAAILIDGAFKEPWLSISMLLYLVALGVSLGLHTPNLKAMNELQRQLVEGEATPTQGGPPAQVLELQERGKKAGMFGGILHLIFAIILILMVVKPF